MTTLRTVTITFTGRTEPLRGGLSWVSAPLHDRTDGPKCIRALSGRYLPPLASSRVAQPAHDTLLLFLTQLKQPRTLVSLGIVKHGYREEKHQQQNNMRSDTDPKIKNATKICREGAAPHKRQNDHDEHPAGGIWNVS